MAEHEKERVVYTDGGRRSGGSTVAIVLGIIALLVVLFLLFGRGMIGGGGDATDIKADVDVSAPAEGTGG